MLKTFKQGDWGLVLPENTPPGLVQFLAQNLSTDYANKSPQKRFLIISDYSGISDVPIHSRIGYIWGGSLWRDEDKDYMNLRIQSRNTVMPKDFPLYAWDRVVAVIPPRKKYRAGSGWAIPDFAAWFDANKPTDTYKLWVNGMSTMPSIVEAWLRHNP